MVTAIVMITTDKSRIPETAQAIAALDGVSSVYSVTGAWDLVAMVKLKRYEDLADVIADQLSKVEGITDTETMLAFRAYSSEDLEEGWALGFDA
ncbi:Lrp/AsnC ligand binding domain-containing protein [Micrococcus sp. 2A]|uniref:Lrp/AsnC family transcriptional regulator n=1 Tax=Micrococcus TaxID=1269 RepID=UPI002006285D|nr:MULTISPECIES: Lrp/AsnC ligand binding domain-containing protein [unclassified Micrococcus]MCK6094835.1 Lrp/AsnC ligand binding domain-containing protein [Micrococcus sp. EYE_212]MCK6170782.1 Lrp/AsnC ligand binding domain-containing protein [Micrococcus sp. EYE_162]MDX2340453.1 Lrp/AsnC ligand binding domain-containing protein [Micrococcus sp. M4NT]